MSVRPLVSRRDFVKTAVAVGVSLTALGAVPSLVSAADAATPKTEALFTPGAASGGVILKNAKIIDPFGSCREDAAIVIQKEVIQAVCSLPDAVKRFPAAQIVDLGGLYCCAGFIDMHTHLHGAIGLPADDIGVYSGVTTLLDCGSAGADTFGAFRSDVIEKSNTEIYALLHIARKGITSKLQEAAILDDLDIAAAVTAAKAAPGIIKGLKVRMEPSIVGDNSFIPAIRAKKAALGASLPLMVHIGSEPPLLRDTLELLDKGDMIAHCFHGKSGKIVDAAGGILPSVTAARERGVLFEIGHGGGSFSADTARKATKAGFRPDAISSDLHALSRDKNLYSLAVTMSKFLTFGYTLNDIISLVTVSPARVLGLEGTHGRIEEGRKADLTIFSIKQGEFVFADSDNAAFTGTQLVRPEFAIKAGSPFTCKETAGNITQRQS